MKHGNLSPVHSDPRPACGVMSRYLIVIVSAVLMCLTLLSTHAFADGPEIVQQYPTYSPGHSLWIITRPNVRQRKTEYPQIVFAPGDKVRVYASGCVQTGGSGRTWKRYVNPVGPNSDLFYSGQISIPGATNGLEPFTPAQPAEYNIPLTQSGGFLTLGYKDDAYGDNGYYAHDDGTSNQCRNIGDAQVRIEIWHPPAVQPSEEADYDFTLNWLLIKKTRSKYTDTDYLSLNTIVNGNWSPIIRVRLGDIRDILWPGNPTTDPVYSLNAGIYLSRVRPDDRVAVIYTIDNDGGSTAHDVNADVEQVFYQIGSALPDPFADFVKLAAAVERMFFDLLDPACDGPVVAGKFGDMRGTQLFGYTEARDWVQTQGFPGAESNAGCGDNSLYDVNFTLHRSQPASSFRSPGDPQVEVVPLGRLKTR